MADQEPIQILMVDDDPEEVALLSGCLSRLIRPNAVETVSTVKEALDRASRQAHHLIFFNLRLSKKAGLGLDVLKTLALSGPVIVLMGRGDSKTAAEAMEMGAADYLARGEMSCDRVLRTVFHVMEQTRLSQEKAGLQAEMKRLTASLDEEVRKKTEEAHQAQRLAAIGEAASHLAHDLRGPLVALELSVNHLRKRTHLDASSLEILDEMGRSLAALEQLVGEVLELARPQTLHVEDLDVHALLDGVLHQLEDETAQRQVGIKRAYAEGIRTLRADPAKLGRVFQNILVNAFEAMDKGGELRVATRQDVQDRNVAVTVTVADSGPGIPQDQLAQIFNPFYTTKPKGTGLGLPIAQRLVGLHGGRLHIESREGQGTTVTVTLPVDGARD